MDLVSSTDPRILTFIKPLTWYKGLSYRQVGLPWLIFVCAPDLCCVAVCMKPYEAFALCSQPICGEAYSIPKEYCKKKAQKQLGKLQGCCK